MAKRSVNESVSRDESLYEPQGPLHLEDDGHSEMKLVSFTSNPTAAENSAVNVTTSSQNEARKEKSSNSCKDNLKKYSKFWNFLSKKRTTDCGNCDPEVTEDDVDDQPEAVAVSCLCTGLKRQTKHSQELPNNFDPVGDLSSFQSEDPLHRIDLSERVLPSVLESVQNPLGSSSMSATGVGTAELTQPTGLLSPEAVVHSSVQSICCAILNSTPRPGMTSSSCSLRNQSTPSAIASTGNVDATSCVMTNEGVFLDFTNVDHQLTRSFVPPTIHTQVDYIHYLVPDLKKIANCSYYWGVMDRYEAERLLDGRPEGTFLLRDSAQEEFLFSVSFRRYSRSLHARVEHCNHRFSFDAHDANVFSSPSVCGLIEHYKDPACCMFFEPMLTLPLVRTFPFSLQHLCRAAICSSVTYDGISFLPIPKSLHQFLQYYHYKKKVRVRRFDATPNQ